MKKNLLYILGAVFLIIGIVGFFNDPIFGIFETDTEHNIIHIVSGLLSLYFANRTTENMVTFGVVMTFFYGIVFLAGLFVPEGGEILGVVSTNTADQILHLLLTGAFAYIAFAYEGFPARSVHAN